MYPILASILPIFAEKKLFSFEIRCQMKYLCDEKERNLLRMEGEKLREQALFRWKMEFF